MLDLFNSLGVNWYRRVISTKDIQGTTIGYAMLRAFESPEMRKYLEFVHGHDQDHLGTGVPFEFCPALWLASVYVASAATRSHNQGRPALLALSGEPECLRTRLLREIDRRR